MRDYAQLQGKIFQFGEACSEPPQSLKADRRRSCVPDSVSDILVT
jgi:hypothetical protein